MKQETRVQRVWSIFGHELQLPCDLVFSSRPGEVGIFGEGYIENLCLRMNNILERVHVDIQIASNQMKKHYDVRAQKGACSDLVLLYQPQQHRDLIPKLQRL